MRFLMAAFAVAASFVLVLGLGVWIERGGHKIPDAAGWIGGLGIAAIAILTYCLFAGISPLKEIRWQLDGIMMRLPRPVANPQRLPVKQRSAEEIVYDANPTAVASCVHLQPIERAMRMAGVDVHIYQASENLVMVKAACRINEAELKRVFALSESIYYAERYQPERSQWDNPRADIFCADCLKIEGARSDINVLHGDECRDDTPWFPSPPG